MSNTKRDQNSTFTFIDLFAGIGGFRMAMEQLGGKCVFSSEWNKKAQDTYFRNYGERPYGDITSKEVKSNIPSDFDVLCAGFPCQPFSICGKKSGFEDTRGTLFFEICQIIKERKPKCCILENVQHLAKHDCGRTFEVILNSLKELGYNVSFQILNARDFGLPQSRERIFIVATLNGSFDFSELVKSPSKTLNYFLDKDADFEYLEPEEYTLLDKTDIKRQPKTGLVFCGYRNKGLWKKGTRPNTEHLSRVHRQPNRIYSVEGSHPTIPSQESSGRFFIYLPEQHKVRKLTVNECYKIMGFPDGFIKSDNVAEQYRQIGNSVAIPVVKSLIESIIKQGLLDINNRKINESIVRGYTKSLFKNIMI